MTRRYFVLGALFLAVLALSGFTACPRYEDVRRLSSEEINAQQKQLEARKAYYAAIDKVLDQSALLANMVIDDATNQQMTARSGKLLAELSGLADTDATGKAALLRAAAGDI